MCATPLSLKMVSFKQVMINGSGKSMKWVENPIMPIELFFAINADVLDGYSILKNLDKKHWIIGWPLEFKKVQMNTSWRRVCLHFSSIFVQVPIFRQAQNYKIIILNLNVPCASALLLVNREYKSLSLCYHHDTTNRFCSAKIFSHKNNIKSLGIITRLDNPVT